MRNKYGTRERRSALSPGMKRGVADMMAKTLSFLILISLIAAGHLHADSNKTETKVFRLSDRKVISYGQMIDDLNKTDVVFAGETHDREAHHQLQLDIIKALRAKKSAIAVGFEMFTYESQKDLDNWVAGNIPENDFIKIYYRDWNFPWALYDDIFLFVRDSKIPAIALNVPAEITRKVASAGFGSLTKEELAKLPAESGCRVDERYMKFIRRAYAMHGHGGKNFLYFCEAQLLWDQVMARTIVEYRKKYPEKTVVVITGNGHAWKRGIPEQLQSLSGKTSVRVVLPRIPGHIDPSSVSPEDADYILLQ